jgi:hypothetical protein
MSGHTLKHRDEPDPESDRRFAERRLPLLEPVSWDGERHWGGYGVRGRDAVTSSLGLIFGPWDRFVSQPRLAIDVGDEFPMSVTGELAAVMTHWYFIADRRDLLRPPDPDETRPRFTAAITIEGAGVSLDALGDPTRWVGEGAWREFRVFIHSIAIQPDEVRLRIADDVPPR